MDLRDQEEKYITPKSSDYLQLQHPSLPITIIYDGPPHSNTHQMQTSNSQAAVSSSKRKNSYVEYSDNEDDSEDTKSMRTLDENRKQNHSEIEKRRRDKMNTYITELQQMIPMCHAMSRKLDKLTVLRMAVQHLKQIRGSSNSYTEGNYKPTFLSDQELKMLILQAAEGFLFVVGCDRGRILYVSDSVSNVLNCSQTDLLGQSWFDILHPKDVAKVKEQLSSPDLSRDRFIDAKTMLPVRTDMPQELPRLCPGARRSFFCRMKSSSLTSTMVKEESDTSSSSQSSSKRKSKLNSDKRYKVIQCTGYLKNWSSLKSDDQNQGDTDGDSNNGSCLVAVGRIPPNLLQTSTGTSLENQPRVSQIQFFSRHALDGKFLFIDQRATLVLGFLPQELLGTSMYEYYHHEDIPTLSESHKMALQNSEELTTSVYRFRSKTNGFIRLQSDWKSFKNPWTKEIDYLMAKNSVYLVNSPESNSCSQNSRQMGKHFDFFNQSNGKEMHRMINSHVEAGKIGRQIAEQVLDYHKKLNGSSSENSPDPDKTEETYNKPPALISEACKPPALIPEAPNKQTSMRPPSVIPNRQLPNDIESNENIIPPDVGDEAAMAAIMSLLDSEAELPNTVDFSNLQWSLP